MSVNILLAVIVLTDFCPLHFFYSFKQYIPGFIKKIEDCLLIFIIKFNYLRSSNLIIF